MAGLEDLYREIILDHYRSPRNRGELPTPPAHRVEGFNPLCGDEVVVYLDVEDHEPQSRRELRISSKLELLRGFLALLIERLRRRKSLENLNLYINIIME